MNVPLNPAVQSVSAFFPCYNDELSIARMVTTVHETLERLGIAHDVTVVDDASRDGSLQVLRDLAQEVSELRIVEHPTNRGFGGALMTSPSDSSADEVNKGDLETARLLGVRVAEFANKLK